MKKKTSFEKWLTKSGFYKRNRRILTEEDYKFAWNAAIRRCLNILKQYDDTTLKIMLNELKCK